MKNIMKCGLVALSLTVGTTFLHANPHENHHDHTHMHTASTPSDAMMAAMHKPMQNATFEETNNLEFNFLANMIPHHEGAIQSAKVLLEHSTNDEVRKIAQEIIKVQQAEVDNFKKLLAKLKTETTTYSKKVIQKFNQEAKADMDFMHKKMMEVKLSGNIDSDFLAGMIPHHEGAIKAAKQILKHTKDDVVKAIAHGIIKAQEQEIKDFQKFLKK